jgi:hypothetical protein
VFLSSSAKSEADSRAGITGIAVAKLEGGDAEYVIRSRPDVRRRNIEAKHHTPGRDRVAGFVLGFHRDLDLRGLSD